METEKRVVVVLPTFDRPEVLRLTLPNLVKSKFVSKIIVLAEASSEDGLKRYEEIIHDLCTYKNVEFKPIFGSRLGSVHAYYQLYKLAEKAIGADGDYVLSMDDDFLLPCDEALITMIKDLLLDKSLGMVSGRVINLRRRGVDPDFYLDIPPSLVDAFSKVFGYIFLNVKHGPRYAFNLAPFFMVKGELLNKIRYDLNYGGCGFREETDLQFQVKKLNYRLVHDPRAYVWHLAPETGGARSERDKTLRIFWKARNHTYFVLKWDRSALKRLWHVICGALLLILYRPLCIIDILKGVKEGYRTWVSTFLPKSKDIKG